MNKYVKWSLIALVVLVLGWTTHFAFKQYKLYEQSEFDFLRAKINKITFKGVTITMFFTFNNRTDVNFSVEGQRYDIYLNGKFYKTLSNPNIIEIPSKETAVIPITVDIEYGDVSRVLFQNISEIARNWKKLVMGVNGHLTINVEGKVLQLKDFPIEYEDSLENIV